MATLDNKPLPSRTEVEQHFADGKISEAERDGILQMIEAWGEPEELDPELRQYLETTPNLGKCLRHPLVYSMMYHPVENPRLNKMLRAKRDGVQRALGERNFNTAVYLHERPWRLNAFHDFAWRMRDREYWRLLGSIWTDSENICQNYQLWHDCLHSDRSCRWAMMDKDERDALRRLKRQPMLLVHRGYAYDEGDTGMSWTTELKTAHWFAKRFGLIEGREHPCVASGVVRKEDIIAHFTGRGESEIVAFPEHVEKIKVVAL